MALRIRRSAYKVLILIITLLIVNAFSILPYIAIFALGDTAVIGGVIISQTNTIFLLILITIYFWKSRKPTNQYDKAKKKSKICACMTLTSLLTLLALIPMMIDIEIFRLYDIAIVMVITTLFALSCYQLYRAYKNLRLEKKH